MREKLIIKNFGPIKFVELELRRFNILIGSQGTGKSTIIKVFASIQNMLYSTGGGASQMMQVSQLNSIEYFKKHLSVYEIDSYLKTDSFISLSGKEIYFKLENEIIDSNLEKILYSDFLSNNDITYIPADRIATSLFSEATWPDLINVAEGKVDMPKYFLRFFSLFSRLKKKRTEFDFTEILNIKFKHENEIDKIILKNGDIISIGESASAIQSNLSLLIIVDSQTEKRKDNSHRTFIIEEPELNLFPLAQDKLMQYLVDKTMNFGNSIFLTTHSPYILTSLNNLTTAYHVGQKHKEEVEKIIKRKYWLNPDDVSAYMMLPNGKCEDIFAREEFLIHAEKIDSVSNILNEQFDELLNIDFAINE